MKRLFILLLIVATIFSIYYDLSKGTLPMAIETNTSAQSEMPTNWQSSISYFDKEVQSGETVLSIIEKQLNGPIPVPIDEITKDFRILNNGTEANKIQIGKIYKFPDYSKIHE
ncbi:hypothetical protein [Robertmurraya siralis]|uniref:hypothetical protein n=1 Tax=Robertmurraya siralis TaxID=77777 RepID=UPI0010F60BB7|nr:hypothetical protein [Robertmurraya siralis]